MHFAQMVGELFLPKFKYLKIKLRLIFCDVTIAEKYEGS
jgi:hypothetical protein